MTSSEDEGGPSAETGRSASVRLPIAVLAWRVRLGSSAVTVVYLMAGTSTALLFAAALGTAALVFVAGSALARLELRLRSMRTERRR